MRSKVRRLLVPAVAVVVGIGVGVGVTTLLTTSSGAPRGAPATAVADIITIRMAHATSSSCGAAVPPGTGHPDPVLTREFLVSGAGHTRYILGWELVPFRGANRSYRLGQSGNLMALEPSNGGLPLGYGTGTVTVGSDAGADAGSVDARIALRDHRTVVVSGNWTCRAGS